jgi:hypothetical protein
LVLDVNAPGLPAHGASFHTDRVRSLWLPASPAWLPLAGAPDWGLRNSLYGAIAFDKDSTESVGTSFTVPHDFASALAIQLLWTNLGAGSGNVAWRVGLNNQGDGGSLSGVTTFDTGAVAAPAQNVWKYTASSAAFPNAAQPGQHVLITCGRLAADAGDTLANDAGFLGYLISYTADM